MNAQDISRSYIAEQTGHRTGAAFQIIDRRPRFSLWALFVNASALGGWVILAAICWIGSGR